MTGVIGGVALRYRGVTVDWRIMQGFDKLANNLDATVKAGIIFLVGYAPLAR